MLFLINLFFSTFYFLSGFIRVIWAKIFSFAVSAVKSTIPAYYTENGMKLDFASLTHELALRPLCTFW